MSVTRRSETPTMCPNCHSTRPPDAVGDLVRCPATNCRALHETGNRFVRASDYRGAEDLLRELADEAANAVCEPARFDQQALGQLVARARLHLGRQ